MHGFRKFVVYVFDVRSMFVDCREIQDCELRLDGEHFDSELNLLGDLGKTRSTYCVFKVTQDEI